MSQEPRDGVPPETTAETTPAEGLLGFLGISSLKRLIAFLSCLAIALGCVVFVPAFDELEPAARRALFILLFAALLWITEAIQAFAVGLLVIALNIALLSNPQGRAFATASRDWEQFVVVIGNPLVWLFFGGFVLAAGMAKTGLDRWVASNLIGRLGRRPASVLFGVMLTTFVLSMFMSNTATTAMMVAMLAPLVATLDKRFATGLLLGVAAAANLGGMGSLIGTPPNAIAVGALSQLDEPIDVSFLQWMAVGLPVGAGLLLLVWGLLLRLYPAGVKELPRLDWSDSGDERAPAWQVGVVAITLVVTIGLWMTAQWHNAPTAVVSFLPIVIFTAAGILGSKEVRTLNYDVLFLLAGGLALGQVVTDTGLAAWIVAHIPTDGLGIAGIAFGVSVLTLLLSNFMSNTAAANIVIPLSVTMAVGAEPRVAIPIALSASAAMCLPIATPPNAIVFATGRCATKDFLRVGLIVGILTPLLAVLWSELVLDRILG